MTDEGKDADLRPGDPSPETVRVRDIASKRTASRDGSGTRRERDEHDAPAASDHGNLSAHTRDRLAAQLRAMYDTVALQPVPDRFADLIARLDAGDPKTKKV